MASKGKREAIKAPSEEEWESRKCVIHEIYDQGTLKHLIHTMESEYNFVASKNQFERRLKDWGFRKYMIREELESVLRKKRKREDSGKKSRFVLQDKVLSEKRIKKAQRRFPLVKLRQIESQCRDTPSPPGISVSTPPGEMETISQRIRYLTIQFDNLPSKIFRDFLMIQSACGWYVEDFRSDLLSVTRNPNSITKFHHKGYLSGGLRDHHLPYFYPRITENEQPLFSGEDVAPIHPMKVFIFGPSWHWAKPSQSTIKQLVKSAVERSTLDLDDKELNHQLEKLFAPHETLELINFVVHFASNNMFDLVQAKQLLDWVTSQTDQFLQRVFAIELHAIQACWDTLLNISIRRRRSEAFRVLLRAASSKSLISERLGHILHGSLEMKLDDIVEELLKTGFDVNTPLVTRESRYGSKHIGTYLGVARTATAARLLLQKGSDVDALSYCPTNRVSLPPIYQAVQKGGSDLLQVFLNYSAKFDPNLINNRGRSVLSYAVERQDIQSINLLFARGARCQDILQPFPKYETSNPPYTLRTELQEAAFSGDEGTVAALLATQSGRAILRTGKYSWTPLRDAALAGNKLVAKMLIDAGADIESTGVPSIRTSESLETPTLTFHPCTALIAAIQYDHPEIVQLLLPHYGVDLITLALDEHGRNALELAEALGNWDIVSLLRLSTTEVPERDLVVKMYKCGLDMDIQSAHYLNKKGVNACHLLDAVSTIPAHLSTVYSQGRLKKHLLTERIPSVFMAVDGDPNIPGPRFHEFPLHIAGDASLFDICRQLALRGARLDIPVPTDGSILQLVSNQLHLRGCDDLIRLLVEYGACAREPATDSAPTALQYATFYGRIDIVELLLEAGADVNAEICMGEIAYRTTALQNAVRSEHPEPLVVEMLEMLIERGANVKSITDALTPAILEEKSEEVIMLLLNNGADVRSLTVLQAAIAGFGIDKNRVPDHGIISLLLERGADVNKPNGKVLGFTALQCAASCGDVEVAQMLIERGADINALPCLEYGGAALQIAASQGHLKMAHFLLERGADPNAAGSEVHGMTTLEAAAEGGRLNMVQLLVNAGVNPTASAADLANTANHFVIAQLTRDEMKKGEYENVDQLLENSYQDEIVDSLEPETNFGAVPDFDFSSGGQVFELDHLGNNMEDIFPPTLTANNQPIETISPNELFKVMDISMHSNPHESLYIHNLENNHSHDTTTSVHAIGDPTFSQPLILQTLDPTRPLEIDGLSSTLLEEVPCQDLEFFKWGDIF